VKLRGFIILALTLFISAVMLVTNLKIDVRHIPDRRRRSALNERIGDEAVKDSTILGSVVRVRIANVAVSCSRDEKQVRRAVGVGSHLVFGDGATTLDDSPMRRHQHLAARTQSRVGEVERNWVYAFLRDARDFDTNTSPCNS
jgi:hypothetical protein